MMTDNSAQILRFLDENNIPYTHHTHEALNTMEDCLRQPFVTPDVLFCKNVFLCNRQKTDFFLVIMKPDEPFHTAVVSKELGVSRLSFAPDELLPQMLGLEAGSITPLGLLFDTEKKITFAAQRAVAASPLLAFHPGINTQTVVFESDVFFSRVLPLLGRAPIYL